MVNTHSPNKEHVANTNSFFYIGKEITVITASYKHFQLVCWWILGLRKKDQWNLSLFFLPCVEVEFLVLVVWFDCYVPPGALASSASHLAQFLIAEIKFN